MWTGPEKFSIKSALFRLDITPDRFYGHWKAKIESCENSNTGKKNLLELLDKGGLRRCGNKRQRLQRQIWFVNEIVGRNTSEPQATMTQEAQVACKLCVHVRMNDINTET